MIFDVKCQIKVDSELTCKFIEKGKRDYDFKCWCRYSKTELIAQSDILTLF